MEHPEPDEERRLFEQWLAEEQTPPPAKETDRAARAAPPPRTASVDLHGLTVNEAEAVLRRRLAEARAAGVTTLRVVTGKGLHSKDGKPVLRERINAGLRAGSYGRISRVRDARAAEGGGGVLLADL